MLNASIITIGDELLIGQTIDTNSAFIAQQLNRIGVWVRRRVAVGDVYKDIWDALDEERKQSSLIIITGGLGPTADDITKPLLCNYFGGKMVTDAGVLEHVKYLFEKIYRRPGPILERNLRQADVPDVCTVLHNARGSAPGMWFETEDDRVFVSLPGVPHEMRGLIENEVIPRVLKRFPLPAIVHRTAFTAGMGESMIAERLIDFEASLPAHIKLAYLPSYGMVRLRLTSQGPDRETVEKEMIPFFDQLKTLVQDVLVADTDEGLEIVVGKILKAKGKTVATAESCTGGYIAHLLTSIPGSSAYYQGSIVSYANGIKEKLLNVPHETLVAHGAVSEQTVIEMAQNARNLLGTDYAVATSGIMGPDGGTDEKPVGTVWVAVAGAQQTATLLLNLRFDRERNIAQTAAQALNFLRKFILAHE
ncbi:CinA family nicotinamide mononucleotide deamidase-related protein [Nostoc ellipsosporum NOK]|jgi:nicotinamide-nucleotide amidase|nr:CinA family nicotinamide mononucleotide deamidase-related protein [Nostoc ellipsosporum NOK]